MVGARHLQAPDHVIVQAGAVADEDRDDDRGGLRIARRDEAGGGGAGAPPRARRRLRPPRAALGFDERGALDRPHQDERPPQLLPERRRPAEVQEHLRATQGGRRPHAAARGPLPHVAGAQGAGHVQLHAPRCATPPRGVAHALDVNDQPDAARHEGGVLGDDAVHEHVRGRAIEAAAGGGFVEPREERRVQDAVARRRAVGRGGADTGRDEQHRRASARRCEAGEPGGGEGRRQGVGPRQQRHDTRRGSAEKADDRHTAEAHGLHAVQEAGTSNSA